MQSQQTFERAKVIHETRKSRSKLTAATRALETGALRKNCDATGVATVPDAAIIKVAGRLREQKLHSR